MTRPTHDELETRVAALRWFRFQRAIGGHAHDGDSLVASISYADEADRLALCERLGLAEPGMTRLFGEAAYVTFAQGRLCVYLGGPSYDIERKDLDAAERLEEALDRAGVTPDPRDAPK